MILEWFLSISAPSWGIPISVSTWKQESCRLTSPDGFRTLAKALRVLQGVIHRKKIRVGLPENTESQFLTWCLPNLFYTNLQGAATNLWVKKPETAIFPKSEGILSGSFLLDWNAVLLQSRNCFSAHENRLGLFTAHESSLSHTTSFPPKEGKISGGNDSTSSKCPSDVTQTLLTPLPTCATLQQSFDFSPGFSLTSLPLPFPCSALTAAHKSSKLLHAREIPD